MLKHTPFHPRTAALCQSHAWRRWAGYVVPATDAEPLLVCSTGPPRMPVVPLATLTLASPLAR